MTNINGLTIEPYANLRGADLVGVNLSSTSLIYINLSYANLIGTNLRGTTFSNAKLFCANISCANASNAIFNNANLKHTDFSSANLNNAIFNGSNLRGAVFSNANLSGADFSNANLDNAIFSNANLSGATFGNANISGALFNGANLRGTDFYGANLERIKGLFFQIPQEGELIVYKKTTKGVVKLRVPPNAKRTATPVGRKCRAEFVEVLEAPEEAWDAHSQTVLYKKGETIYPDKYNPDWRIECTHGIHFFLTKEEAENYHFN